MSKKKLFFSEFVKDGIGRMASMLLSIQKCCALDTVAVEKIPVKVIISIVKRKKFIKHKMMIILFPGLQVILAGHWCTKRMDAGIWSVSSNQIRNSENLLNINYFIYFHFFLKKKSSGVVSAGYSCASRGQPGIYHRVPYTVDWISYVSNLNK